MPRHVLQQTAPIGLGARLRASAGLGGGAVLVHVALGAALFFLLSFRDAEVPREVEIPVEVVTEPPKTEPPKTEPPKTEPPKTEPPKPAATNPAATATGGPVDGAAAGEPARTAPPAQAAPSPQPAARPLQPASDAGRAVGPAAGASAPPAATPPRPAPEATPAPKPPSTPPQPAAPQPTATPSPPKLVAPPPEAARSATQAKDNKPANLVPDEHQTDQATREARPVPVPDVLTTPDAGARTSVPVPAKPQPAPPDRPTPPTTAKVPSQADKLAAALPMDAGAMPSPFRSVLAGNAAAQINAAYGGVVQGRIRQATAELSGAASAQHLSGAVAVTFTLDDAGKLAKLDVVQSSGNAELDAMVLHAIEGTAPFPPPPPEADHTFNKAFLVGG